LTPLITNNLSGKQSAELSWWLTSKEFFLSLLPTRKTTPSGGFASTWSGRSLLHPEGRGELPMWIRGLPKHTIRRTGFSPRLGLDLNFSHANTCGVTGIQT